MGTTAKLAVFLSLACCAAAQSPPARLLQVTIVPSSFDLHIVVSLSSPVKPILHRENDPPRVVLDFPDTTTDDIEREWIAVGLSGVVAVTYGPLEGTPRMTRVTVELDREASFELRTEDNRVGLDVSPAVVAQSKREGGGAPATAANSADASRGPVPAPETSREGSRPINPTAASNVGAAPLPGIAQDEKHSNTNPVTSTSADVAKTPQAAPIPGAPADRSENLSRSTSAQVVVMATQARLAAATVAPAPMAESENAGAQPAVSSPPVPSTSAQSPADTAGTIAALDPNLKTVFRVKYVAEGVAYLDGGSSAGLKEGTRLEIRDSDLPGQQGAVADAHDPRVVAGLIVAGVAETSAVADIHDAKREVKQGDLAYLGAEDAELLIQQKALSPTRSYPMVVSFTEDDPQDEEVRSEVPRPPLPSVNRARGWIGFDQMGTITHGSPGMLNTDYGLSVRADMTRIGGTYWNLTGYWRGRLSSTSSDTQPTLQDLLNRTYHIGLTYDNPNGRWVAGIGRLYLPWAPSLDTIDGGYFGFRPNRTATIGLFGGSTPDPTSWNYNPDQRIGGAFVNFQGGRFDAWHYSSTSGAGISALGWTAERPFIFFENNLSFKRYLSIYDSLEGDSPRGNAVTPAPGPGLSRNFLTVRLQVHPRLELDLNHNYFRDIPTFDPTLIGTGLLDKYLFQGLSGGARAEVVKHVFLYGSVGRSNRTGDAKDAWNEMGGVAFDRLPWFGLRADAHYSTFTSSFGDGSYKAFTISRDLNESVQLSVLTGIQNYTSTLAENNQSRFLTGNVGWLLGLHYFWQTGFTVNRGGTFSYDQWIVTMGYRFDSKGRRKQ